MRIKVFIANFARELSFYNWRGQKNGENANGAAGSVSGTEVDALGERPQYEITLLPVLCPELRLMRPWGALKCSI